MKYLKTLLILIAFPSFLFAQSNYKPGYIVTLRGDTTRGEIDYREWLSTPGSVSFKTSDAARKFTPADIALFSIDGLETYQSYTGPISMDPPDTDHRDTTFINSSVFLKVLEKGSRVSLFSYTDNVKVRLFFEENSKSGIKELAHRVYYTMENNGGQFARQIEVNENTYLKQLTALAVKYNVYDDALQTDMAKTGYYEQDVLKVVSKINGVSDADYKAKYGSKFKLNLFVGAGINATATKPFGAYKAAGGINYNTTLPFISFGADFFANPKTKRLAFRMEFMASGNQYKSSTIYTGSPYVPVRYSYTQLWGAVAPQVIYNFYSTENLKIYGGAGLALTWYKYSNATYDLNYASTQVKNAPINNPNFLYKAATPIMLKAGAVFGGHWGVFINYLTPAKVSRDDYLLVKTNPLLAGLNYYL
ncbi:hypothetical protein [Mucilaginibacter ginsenosidivorans]|uniref:PorT family protein n=1 Tax=Mucilaginibacter ginsenosidivorans TaxID=398053 RepID=A0A5B8UWY1_9SPHI|nr:hypothetical protein [Mucilaginibacter ginsenosidivorans]QEC62906.1 hypothetical protein FRZ54_10060 [Mucilaginibacter ginsenosidivorans]